MRPAWAAPLVWRAPPRRCSRSEGSASPGDERCRAPHSRGSFVPRPLVASGGPRRPQRPERRLLLARRVRTHAPGPSATSRERRCRGGCVPSPPSPACPGRSARVCGGRCSVAVRGHSRAGGRPDRPVTRPQGCVSAWAQGPLVKRAERRRMSLILWATASPLSRKGRSWPVFSVSKSDPSVPSRAKRPEA